MTPPQASIDDVVIRFTRESHYQDQVVYHAEVRESPILLRGGPFKVDVEQRLDRFHELYANRLMPARGDNPAAGDADPQTTEAVRNLGHQLYELLPDALCEGLPRLLQHVFDKGRSVSLVFEAAAGDQADRLLSLPWEITYFKRLKTHLGLMQQVIITRRLLGTVRRASPFVAAPFHIAHVVARPRNFRRISDEICSTEHEAVQTAAGLDGFYTLVAQPGSVQRLQQTLRTRDYQVVHFLGHGEIVTDVPDQGYLVFADEDGSAQAVSGEQFLHLLGATPSIQLVVLNSCHGASVTAAGSIAMRLVYGGVPYVVAMQHEIRQQAAVVFAKTFYGAVQQGVTIGRAVALARVQIATEMQGGTDWSLPTLYTSLGAPPETRIARVGSRIERWLTRPEGQRQIGGISLGFGGVHLLVAMLLALSGGSPAPPGVTQVIAVIGAMAALPPLLALAARRSGRLPMPAESRWPYSVQATLLLRMLGAAALGVGLPAFWAWLLLLLFVALGFWGMLAPAAQILLLVVMFVPGALLSWQEAISHGIGFMSNARVAAPVWDWTETLIVAAGYAMLCGPLALLWLAPQSIAPPQGNLYAGVILAALGYWMRRNAVERRAPPR